MMKLKQKMKVRMTNRDLKILLYIGGVLILFVSYFYGFLRMQDTRETLELENRKLQTEEQQLKKLINQKETYIADTQQMKMETQIMQEQFPVLVQEEDVISFADLLEEDSDMKINSIGFAQGNLLGSLGQPQQTVDATTGSGTGTEDGDKEVIPDNTVNMPTETANQIGVIDEANVQLPSYSLMATSASYDFTAGYQSFKQIFRSILENPDKRNISSLSISYDGTTGRLIGNMTLNLYYLTGTEETYQEPATNNQSHGKDNLFGTMEEDTSSNQD